MTSCHVSKKVVEKFSFSELKIEKVKFSNTKIFCINVFNVGGCVVSCLPFRPILTFDSQQLGCLFKKMCIFIYHKKTQEPRMCLFIITKNTASLEHLAHHRNVTNLNLFCRYYFGRCSSELAQLPFSRGGSTRYSDRLHDFSFTIARCYKDVYVNSFFPRTARPWNSLPIECFPLTYDLSGLKSRIKRHYLNVGCF